MHAAAGQPLRLRSRCGSAAPAASIPLRSVACGEQLAEDWCLVGGVRDGGWHRGAISLRSDPTFCIALGSAAPEARPETFPKRPPPLPPPVPTVLAECAGGDPAQQRLYMYSPGGIGGLFHNSSKLSFGPSAGPAGALEPIFASM
jgi:hypothetical protein